MRLQDGMKMLNVAETIYKAWDEWAISQAFPIFSALILDDNGPLNKTCFEGLSQEEIMKIKPHGRHLY